MFDSCLFQYLWWKWAATRDKFQRVKPSAIDLQAHRLCLYRDGRHLPYLESLGKRCVILHDAVKRFASTLNPDSIPDPPNVANNETEKRLGQMQDAECSTMHGSRRDAGHGRSHSGNGGHLGSNGSRRGGGRLGRSWVLRWLSQTFSSANIHNWNEAIISLRVWVCLRSTLGGLLMFDFRLLLACLNHRVGETWGLALVSVRFVLHSLDRDEALRNRIKIEQTALIDEPYTNNTSLRQYFCIKMGQ